MDTKRYRALDLPITVPLVCLRGDMLRSPLFRHKQPGTDLPRDLTGCTISVKGALADDTAIDLTAYLVTDLVNGKYRVIIPPAVTNGLTPWPVGVGSYDITVNDTLGAPITYWAGQLGLKEGAHV